MDFEAYLLLAVVFLAVVFAVFAVGAIFNRGRALRNRLHGLAQDPTGMQPLDGRGKQWTERLMKWATPMARLATPNEEEELSTLRRNLMNAGFRQVAAPAVFFAAKATLAMVVPAVISRML